MSQKTWVYVCVAGLLTLAACWWTFRGKPRTPADDPLRSMFYRPATRAPVAAELDILIDGIDALEDLPTVASNQKVSISVFVAQKWDPNETCGFDVIPRLPNQGIEGFGWTDISCDLFLSLNNPRPVPLGTGWVFDLQATFHLKPGDYVLRYYRQFRHMDSERLPRTEFVGEGRLRVISSKSSEPCFIPLENKKMLIRNP